MALTLDLWSPERKYGQVEVFGRGPHSASGERKGLTFIEKKGVVCSLGAGSLTLTKVFRMTFWDDASSSSETLFGSHVHPRQISRVSEWTTAATTVLLLAPVEGSALFVVKTKAVEGQNDGKKY